MYRKTVIINPHQKWAIFYSKCFSLGDGRRFCLALALPPLIYKMPNPPTSSGVHPFLSIPDVVRERIYAYVLTVDVYDSSPWITPLPALSHSHNKALAILPTIDNTIPFSELTAKRKRDRLRKEETLRIRESEALANLEPPVASSCLAILATCRTILLEAFHLWYQNNTLNFTRSEDIYTFLISIGSVRANEIRSLRFDLALDDWTNPKAKFALGRLLKLERLTVVRRVDVLKDGTWFEHNYQLPGLVMGLRGLREVEVVTCGESSERTFKAIEGLKKSLMRPRKLTRKPPRMVDLFGKLKKGKETVSRQSEQEMDEVNGYAPDMASSASGVFET